MTTTARRKSKTLDEEEHDEGRTYVAEPVPKAEPEPQVVVEPPETIVTPAPVHEETAAARAEEDEVAARMREILDGYGPKMFVAVSYVSDRTGLRETAVVELPYAGLRQAIEYCRSRNPRSTSEEQFFKVLDVSGCDVYGAEHGAEIRLML